MGNAESSDSLATIHRAKSQSPAFERNSGSEHGSSVCKDANDASRQCVSVTLTRRSKTCRQRSSRRKEVCRVTGLTLHQKALLMRKWNRMESGQGCFTPSEIPLGIAGLPLYLCLTFVGLERKQQQFILSLLLFLAFHSPLFDNKLRLSATIYTLGRRVFESIFNDNPHYLAYIDLKNEPNWNNHINFKIHVQRFVIALSEAMRRLREPSTSYDVLRDFGASYATYPKRVSPLYFERLANALSHTATRLQENDHLRVEKAAIREDDSYSSEGDKSHRSLLDVEKMEAVNESGVYDSKSISSFSMPKHRDSRSSLSRMSSIKDSFQSECLDHDRNGICPITAEAWAVLSAFLANQVSVNTALKQLQGTTCN
ncbi:unnamed protein product [Angiostrongylus costaricensis]|uniref:GLOBIN domain-containing protein n=1 Tax=Angiostrongylus costaricensis TaxID=334426 RepID=A0A0R3P9U4_ANGCS|nr:unnamed protein product [Angiostrongylus costaricensis]